VVTREELRLKLWPADIFVDFDHSLNAAIKRLREALGDSAETPTFIETLSRRGYRFLGNIEVPAASPSSLFELKSPPTSAYRAWARKWHVGAAVVALVIVACVLALWLTWRSGSRSLPQASLTLRRLTTNAAEHWVIASAISPDGKYLAYSDKTGAYFRVLSTGEVHSLVPKVSDVSSLGWFPDSSQVLASWATPSSKKSSVGYIYSRWKRETTERRRLVGFGIAGQLPNCISQESRIRREQWTGNLVDAGKWC
jgi:hypothetical protein